MMHGLMNRQQPRLPVPHRPCCAEQPGAVLPCSRPVWRLSLLQPVSLGPSSRQTALSLCRTYDSVSDQNHFPSGWLAPKLMTPDNAEIVQPVYADSNTTELSGLLGELRDIARTGYS